MPENARPLPITPFATRFLLAILVSLPSAASAQICTGMASFTSGPVRLGAGLWHSDGLNAYS